MTMMPYADSIPGPQPPDAALAAALAGDEHAFATLYRRHSSTVYRFAYLWSGTVVVAAEVAQETFIHLHLRGRGFDAARGELRAGDPQIRWRREADQQQRNNDKPSQIWSEKWFSPELQTVVYSRHSDPRSGENIYRLNNVRRVAQSPELFAVPSGYQIKETMMPPLPLIAPAPPTPPAK